MLLLYKIAHLDSDINRRPIQFKAIFNVTWCDAKQIQDDDVMVSIHPTELEWPITKPWENTPYFTDKLFLCLVHRNIQIYNPLALCN